jgi:hypothetical protein
MCGKYQANIVPQLSQGETGINVPTERGSQNHSPSHNAILIVRMLSRCLKGRHKRQTCGKARRNKSDMLAPGNRSVQTRRTTARQRSQPQPRTRPGRRLALPCHGNPHQPQVTHTCKQCKQKFLSQDNNASACCYHPSLYTGGEVAKVTLNQSNCAVSYSLH